MTATPNIAATIVLYNANLQRLKENISACLPQVERIYLVDNSEHPCFTESKLQEEWGNNIRYIALGENLGIAAALNRGCQEAKTDGYSWILTLDQDSVVPQNLISAFLKNIAESPGNIGIITPQVNAHAKDFHQAATSVEELTTCITSGSLTSLEAFTAIGGFNEALFIDNVDTDFSLRLKENGYRVLRDNSVVMAHQIGNIREYKWRGRHLFNVTHHNYIRRYYITRNNLYINQHYAKTFGLKSYGAINLLKQILKILLFEQDKCRKFTSIRHGIYDFRHDIFGKYNPQQRK